MQVKTTRKPRKLTPKQRLTLETYAMLKGIIRYPKETLLVCEHTWGSRWSPTPSTCAIATYMLPDKRLRTPEQGYRPEMQIRYVCEYHAYMRLFEKC